MILGCFVMRLVVVCGRGRRCRVVGLGRCFRHRRGCLSVVCESSGGRSSEVRGDLVA